MRRVTILLIAAACLAAAPAADTTSQAPRTPAARDALEKLNADKLRAKKAYDDAVSKASNDALVALQKAKGDVMKAGNLDEANRIQAAIDAQKSLTSAAASSPAGKYKWNSRSLTNANVELLPSGGVLCDGKPWKNTWRMKDGYMIMEDYRGTATLAQTPFGWAGTYPDGMAIGLVR